MDSGFRRKRWDKFGLVLEHGLMGSTPTILRARQYEFIFPRPAMIMGIVNVTPDSFSDGGRFFQSEAAIEQGLRLVDQGAEIIDVGGESTRPNAAEVSESEELRRVLPVVEGLATRLNVPISIDTQKPIVAEEALKVGACIVNDIGANREESKMWEIVAKWKAGYVAMHMQGTPQTMQINPTYGNVVEEVASFLDDRLSRLNAAGVSMEQVILDVGIGFGKKVEHNLELLANLNSFTRFHRPLLLGVSRKSFISRVSGGDLGDRLPGALACACKGVEDGVSIVRVHDVRETVQAVRMIEAIAQHEKK